MLPATTARAAMTVAERIRETVADPPYRLPDGGPVAVTISIGRAASANGHADALVRSADAALYEGKRAGRNRVLLAEHGALPPRPHQEPARR